MSKPLGQPALVRDDREFTGEVVGNGNTALMYMIHPVEKIAGSGIIQFALQQGQAQGGLAEETEDIAHDPFPAKRRGLKV
jgi:hypothetical protein